MRKRGEESENIGPIGNHKPADDCNDQSRYDPSYGSLSFRYFRAMFFGSLIGSILGTILAKLLTQLL